MKKIYGYCRVSTPRQHIDRQIENIKSMYPEAEIFSDEWTGRTMERTGWNRLMKIVKKDPLCIVVFDEVSRMSRDAEEGFETYEILMEQGTDLVFLREPYLNTSVYRAAQEKTLPMTGNTVADIYIEATNKLLKYLAKQQIEMAFETSQHEVDYLRERTREGIASARRRGKQIGGVKGRSFITKKEKQCRPEIQRLARDFGGSNTDREVMKILDIDKNTYYKYKRNIIISGEH